MKHVKGPSAVFRTPCSKSFVAPNVFRLFLDVLFKGFNDPYPHLSSLISQRSQFPLQLYKPLSHYILLLCLCMGYSLNKTLCLHILPANSCLYFKTLLHGASSGMPSRLAPCKSLLQPHCHGPSLTRTNSDKCFISPYGKYLSAYPTRVIRARPSHCCISAWHTVGVFHIWQLSE